MLTLWPRTLTLWLSLSWSPPDLNLNLTLRFSPAPTTRPTRPPLPDDRYINRELSWLDFNARVLSLAEDPATPLLERAKFLAIFASNLDEFYMVRVAGLMRRLQTGLPVEGPGSLTSREQLAVIADRTTDLMARHASCFSLDVEPALHRDQVQILRWVDLDASDRERLRTYFREQIFPVLTPLAVDPAHPFPYISGLSLNLAVFVRDPDGGPELFARVKVPNNVPRFVSVDAPGRPAGDVRRAGRRRPAGPVRAGGGAHRRAPRPALLGHADRRAPPVPGHPQRRARGRRRPRRGPAAGARA